MAMALVSTILGQLGSILQQQIVEEVKLVIGADKEVEKLRTNLEDIQAVLQDAEKRQVREAAVNRWLEKLKDISYEIDDVLDEWSAAILKMKIQTNEKPQKLKTKVRALISSPCFYCKPITLRHDIANKIKEVNQKLDAIASEKDRFTFQSVRGIEEPPRPMTTSVVDELEVRGRDEAKNQIVNMLLDGSSEGSKLSIISIVGMGGIGKTTLSQLAYNDENVIAHFDKRIWVCVSDPFDEIKIAKAILDSLGCPSSTISAYQILLQVIQQSIKEKKFLLVLDDVWNEDSTKWKPLQLSLSRGAPGSKILVTTRKESVANVMETTYTYSVENLSEEECWSLLSHVAFYDRTNEECRSLEEVGGRIARKCNGLPLAAKTLGSLLRFRKTKEQWQSVLESEIWNLKEAEQQLFPHLLLSYYDLPSEMRQCFLYSAIFPKDTVLSVDMLIELWMAQGYLKEEMVTVGQTYFDNLAMRSFFQNFEKDDGRIVGCKMHDIVHDFAHFLTQKEFLAVELRNAVDAQGVEFSHGKARHLMLDMGDGAELPISIQNMKKLRSLLIRHGHMESSIARVLPCLFAHLKCLRILHFYFSSFEKVPKEVGRLIHLRCLDFTGNWNLKELPESVCDLCNLQILRVDSCTNLERLPAGMGRLINLRHLYSEGTYNLTFMPKGIAKLTSLQTLSRLIVGGYGEDKEAMNLGDLEQLNNLHVLGITGYVTDLQDAIKADLPNKKHLRQLELSIFYARVGESRRNTEALLEALQPPTELQSLKIEYFEGTTMSPSWLMRLTKLDKLSLWAPLPQTLENLSPLGKLPPVRSLEIGAMPNVRKVGVEFFGIQTDWTAKNDEEGNQSLSSQSGIDFFEKLQRIKFIGMENLEECDFSWMGADRKFHLITDGCPRLKVVNFPSSLS